MGCTNADISDFNTGVTCLDKSGGYVRYLFGRGAFQSEETFDTRIECELCLGVSEDEPRQIKGVVPKQLVEDVNALKVEVAMLREEVETIRSGSGRGTAEAYKTSSALKDKEGRQSSEEGEGGSSGESSKTEGSSEGESSADAEGKEEESEEGEASSKESSASESSEGGSSKGERRAEGEGKKDSEESSGESDKDSSSGEGKSSSEGGSSEKAREGK